MMKKILLPFLFLMMLASPVSAAVVKQHAIFCLKNPEHVLCVPAKEAKADFSKFSEIIKRVNDNVNRRISYTRESTDVWNYNVSLGDCEDYVLTKAHELIKSGLPKGSLRIMITKASGEGHAVLLVDTSKGTLVLDNIRKEVLGMKASGYSPIAISVPSSPMKWKRFN